MGKGSAPVPPNPVTTAQAQTASNINTATAQSELNHVNQVTPYGNLTYTQEAGEGDVPQYTATQTLSPTGQALFDANSSTMQNLADLGVEQSGRLSGLLSEPFSLDNDAVESRLMELGSNRLAPLLEKRRVQQEQSLADRGIRIGSDAYGSAQSDISQGENDAYNQLLLTGRNQAMQEAITARSQPLNEIMAISQGSQIQQPNFAQTPQSGVANTDVAGLISNNYNQQLNAYNQQQQNNNQMLGGLFGVGANLMMLSDDRTKKDKQKVGKTNGMNIWSYRYKDEEQSAPKRLGLMASEVQKRNPDAVTTGEDGLRRVNYSMALGA